jgi:hypothetical protein
VYEALKRTHRPDARIDRFSNCGAGMLIQKSADGTELRMICTRCKDRFCVACGAERSGAFAERVAQHLAGRVTRFITLTLRASNTPLVDQLDRLYRSFAALRRRAQLKGVFAGGACFLECKIGSGSGLWHPHLHIITEGRYIDCRELSREWHKVTGDSSVTKIKAVPDNASRAAYVTKYVTKPADNSVFAVPAMLDEFICAIGGRRLAMTFGTWRGLRLDGDPPEDVKWITVGSPRGLQLDAQAGDANAIRILEAAQRKWPLFAELWKIPPPGDDPL